MRWRFFDCFPIAFRTIWKKSDSSDEEEISTNPWTWGPEAIVTLAERIQTIKVLLNFVKSCCPTYETSNSNLFRFRAWFFCKFLFKIFFVSNNVAHNCLREQLFKKSKWHIFYKKLQKFLGSSQNLTVKTFNKQLIRNISKS